MFISHFGFIDLVLLNACVRLFSFFDLNNYLSRQPIESIITCLGKEDH